MGCSLQTILELVFVSVTPGQNSVLPHTSIGHLKRRSLKGQQADSKISCCARYFFNDRVLQHALFACIQGGGAPILEIMTLNSEPDSCFFVLFWNHKRVLLQIYIMGEDRISELSDQVK